MHHPARLATFLFLLALLPGASAAAPIHERVHGGVTARLNFSNIDNAGIPDDRAHTATGFAAGGFLVVPASSLVAVQAEATWTRKGSVVERPFGMMTSHYVLDYVELAPLLQLGLPVGKVRLFGEAGPVVGLRVNAFADREFSEREVTGPPAPASLFHQRANITDDVSPLEVGVALGAGASIPLQDLGLVVGLRYHRGFTQVWRDAQTDSTSRNLQLLTGLYF